MPKVFVFSVACLLVMVGVAFYASSQRQNERVPASVGQGVPKDLYHSAKY